MKNAVLFFALVLFFAHTVSAQFRGSTSEPVKETRSVSSFDGIVAKGSVNVFVSFGTEESVEVVVDAQYKDQLMTEVRGTDLHIYTEGRMINPKKLDVFVVAKNLKLVEASGATDVSIKGEWKEEKIKIYLSGSSDLDVKEGITCTSLKMEISAASDAELYVVATDFLATLSGSSDINIKGRVNVADILCRGSSDFKGKHFAIGKCKVEASGSSDAYIMVNDELQIEASGSSNVYYEGSPSVNLQKITGSSSVSKN